MVQNADFCLTRVESSLVGSVRTESLRMLPSSSDRGSSSIINSSRLMGAFTFLDFVQPRSFSGDFSFSWRDMTLYSASCFGGNVYRLLVKFYIRLCVCLRILRTFVYGFCVRIRLLHTFLRLLCTLCGFCARCATFVYVYGLSFAQVVRILHMYTAFVRIERLLRTYTAYILRTLCGFCVRIRLIFTMFNADSLEGSDLAGPSISFILANACDSWTV